MKDDLTQFSDILLSIAVFTICFGLIIYFSKYTIPFFPTEIFYLGGLGMLAVGFIIKFIYKNHEHL